MKFKEMLEKLKAEIEKDCLITLEQSGYQAPLLSMSPFCLGLARNSPGSG